MSEPKKLRKPGFKYFFTVEPRIETVPVGEVPGGFRVDLRYVAGSVVKTDPERYQETWLAGDGEALRKKLRPAAGPDDLKQPVSYDEVVKLRNTKADESPLRKARDAGLLEWPGIDGTILSGTDWATVRTDGVITFDGRVTMKTEDNFLVDSVVSGVVDLRTAGGPFDPAAARRLYTDWLNGGLPKPIPLTLAVRFEAADNVESWANAKIKRASEGFWKYERLVRGQFVAIGEMTLQKTTYSPISSVRLDILQLTAEEAR